MWQIEDLTEIAVPVVFGSTLLAFRVGKFVWYLDRRPAWQRIWPGFWWAIGTSVVSLGFGVLSETFGWTVFLLVMAVPFGLQSVAFRERRIRDNRIMSGLCPNCGYDIRGTPERCPECGSLLKRGVRKVGTIGSLLLLVGPLKRK
jgi:hypothetical protein